MGAAVPPPTSLAGEPGLMVPDLGPGLDPAAITAGLARLSQHPDVKALVLFGSRAAARARPGSDLDLMLVTRQKLPPERERELWRLAALCSDQGCRWISIC